ncbi:MAG TPA: phosphotransferase, partial [Acidobacteriota bacterium]|nr:phosphotransferase [Acidobacteriota bacterium]
LNFFRRFYLQAYRNLEVESDRLESEFEDLADRLAAYPRVLCHRDYHVRNLMLKKGEIYIIDFQDARWGPPSYDLVSLLKDSIELEAEEVDELVDYYRQQALEADIRTLENWQGTPEEFKKTLDEALFQEQFQLMCIQRLLKALGTYGYQITQREHFIYEQYISGSLHRALLSLEEVKRYPAIEAVVRSELRERLSR